MEEHEKEALAGVYVSTFVPCDLILLPLITRDGIDHGMHYHAILYDDSINFHMVSFQSNEETMNYLIRERGYKEETLPFINPNNGNNSLDRSTWADCNRVLSWSKVKLRRAYLDGNVRHSGKISLGDYEQIRTGLQESSFIEPIVPASMPEFD